MIPKLGDAKVDKILSQFSQFYTNDQYISEQILPVLKVKEKTGKFAKYGKENLRVYTDQIFRAPGTRANNVDYSVSQGDYICKERAIEKRVPDEMANNTDDPYDAKRDATAVLMDNIWINQERALQQSLTSTAIITTNNTTLTGTSQWSDYNNSDPFDDISVAIEGVRASTGRRPNVMVLCHDVWMKLKYHPDVREQLKYTGGNGNISEGSFGSFLKDFFNLSEVLVGSAVMNSADEGQSASIADVWTKDAWLMSRTPSPTLMQATFGLTLSDVPRQVDTYREETHLSDVVRQRYSYDQNIMDEALCYLVKAAIA